MIKFPMMSLFRGIDLFRKKDISFIPLLDKKINDISENKDDDPELDFKVLINPKSKFDLPKYHQKLPELRIDYQDYFLIYVSIREDDSRGYDIKIDRIIQKEDQIIVKIKIASSANDLLTLEVINIPYDLVKVHRNNLKSNGTLKFKFMNQQDELLYSEDVVID